jgi:hypothetical protein
MPVVIETATGQPIDFLPIDFLEHTGREPFSWERKPPPSGEIEMFPHFMIPRVISASNRHLISQQIYRLLADKKDKIDPEMEIEVYSRELEPPNIYRRSPYIQKSHEALMFKDIIIITVKTMGFSDLGNSLCKGSEPWAVHPLDPYRQEKQERQIYTYGIYADYDGETPRTYFGPLHIPYFKDHTDPRPLTKSNLPYLFNCLTSFLRKKVKVNGERCIRLQRLITDEADIPVMEEQLILNQISAFRKVYAENPKLHMDEFKKYIEIIEALHQSKRKKWLEGIKKKNAN